MQPLSRVFSTPIVVFDTETTGVSRRDRIVEFAAIRVERGRQPISYSTLVNPEMNIPFAAQRVHKISDSMVANAPVFGAIQPAISRLFSGAHVFAHNLNFDRRMLKQDCSRTGTRLDFLGLCTLKLARQLHPGRSGRGAHTLDSMLRIHGITNDKAHRAMADATATLKLLQAFVSHDPATVGSFINNSIEL